MARRPLTPLRRAIFEANRTQAEIAGEIGIDQAHMSRIVNGLHPNDDLKHRIAAALGQNVETLWPNNGLEAA